MKGRTNILFPLFFILFISSLFMGGEGREEESIWSCEVIFSKELVRENSGLLWNQLNCTGSGPDKDFRTWHAGPMIFNVVIGNMSAPGLGLTAQLADPSAEYEVQSVPEIATSVYNSVVGINGGYFWRLDEVPIWFDDVCIGKTRKDAEQPVSATDVNNGVSDTLLIVNGTLLGTNCDLPGYNVPVALVINSTSTNIQILSRGEQLSTSLVQNAIAAGPNLVSFNSSSLQPFVNIPSDDHNVNILEHAANTAVGLVYEEGSDNVVSQIIMITANGYDSCPRTDPTCGIEALPMAYFGKDYLKVSAMMEMDQGGSTTMWISGQPNNGVISESNTQDPTSAPRSVANALFFTLS